MSAPAILTLTRFPDIFAVLRASVDLWEPSARKIVVTSGGASISAPGWDVVPGVEPFIFARNANLGIRAAAGQDVLLINDDCELTQPILAQCEAIVSRSPALGILAPQVAGGVGNRLQAIGMMPPGFRPGAGYYVSRQRLAFVCVYLPARTLALVGALDDRYTGYGGEDRDYCRRVQDAGLELGVTPFCCVRHGFGGRPSSESFRRVMTRAEQDASLKLMHRRFDEKFGPT